jgi:predicted helicase
LEAFQKNYGVLHNVDSHGSANKKDANNVNTHGGVNFETGNGDTHNRAYLRKIDIFHYVYAVLHNPAYRSKYEQNLKRDFPRIPLYENFWQWAAWGKALMDLHIGYETAEPYPLQRVEAQSKARKQDKDEHLFAATDAVKPMFETSRPTVAPKAKLKAIKELGEIQLDEQTKLTGVPAAAWAYKLGNRSALEWILDQYKESTPSDPTIREKFNTYRFADYKEQVIDLLQKVCRVSVQTMEIVGEMPQE